MKKITYTFPLLLAALAALPFAASAHEHRVYSVGGKDYSITVGMLAEPVHTGDKTGVELIVHEGDAGLQGEGGDANPGKPVTGLDQTLKVELSAGSEKKIIDFVPEDGADGGSYEAVFYPSLQTTYAYRIFGTLNSVPLDVTYTCNTSGTATEDSTAMPVSDQVTQKFKTGAFGCPAPASDVIFPAPTLTVDLLDGRVKTLEAAAAMPPKPDTKGTIALVLGALGIILGATALARKPKA